MQIRFEDHIFIIVSTIVFYLFIKYNNKKISQKNLIFYTLLVPVIFYGYHFAFNTTDSVHETFARRISHASSDIMSDTYPLTSTSL
jgi:presenilin-like A22 family membrane protease